MLNILIYCWAGMFHGDDVHSTMPTTERIPAVLMESFLGKGHVLFTDNFYVAPSLAEFLLQNNTHLCGTVKRNKKYYAPACSINFGKRTGCLFQN